MAQTVIVGNGQGFWGDSPSAPEQLVRGGPLDFLTLDYLAEVSMSILQKARSKDPSLGYATDFPRLLSRILPECRRRGIRIVANAGGVNPRGCAEAVAEVARQLGETGLRIGLVTGDDLVDKLPGLFAAGETLADLDTGAALAEVADDVLFANVYFGAAPLVEALDRGAEVVICGRCTDPSLVVAPLVHRFGWGMDDLDRLASATVAGHLLECGTQCTGGNFYRWAEMPELGRIGYPLVEAHADGTFVVTKHPGTGGVVDVESVTAQLVYEIGDPARYLGPDVITDFTSIRLAQQGPDRVAVSGVRGAPPPPTLKVSAGLRAGHRIVAELTVAGPGAVRRARRAADLLFERLAEDGVSFAEHQRHVEIVGLHACLPGVPPPPDPLEVVVRIWVRDDDPAKLARLGREVAPLLTAGPPGLTGYAAGRPRPSSVVRFWPALVARERVQPSVDVLEVT